MGPAMTPSACPNAIVSLYRSARLNARAYQSARHGSMKPVTSQEDAKAAGFSGFPTIGECIENGLPADQSLNQCGVYLICTPLGFIPRFISQSKARKAGNVTRPKTKECLKEKWVDGADVLYIGAAGVNSSRTLRKRLNLLLRHSLGRTKNHTGGQILWQLLGFRQLLVCWYPIEGTKDPRKLEKSLIREFKQSNQGKRPFANLRD